MTLIDFISIVWFALGVLTLIAIIVANKHKGKEDNDL